MNKEPKPFGGVSEEARAILTAFQMGQRSQQPIPITPSPIQEDEPPKPPAFKGWLIPKPGDRLCLVKTVPEQFQQPPEWVHKIGTVYIAGQPMVMCFQVKPPEPEWINVFAISCHLETEVVGGLEYSIPLDCLEPAL
jgi:hypothetical protein